MMLCCSSLESEPTRDTKWPLQAGRQSTAPAMPQFPEPSVDSETVSEDRLPAGARVSGEVTDHATWGLLLGLDDERIAVVDLLYIVDLSSNPGWPPFPAVGSRVEGVV